MTELIILQVKEEVVCRIRETLQYTVEGELDEIMSKDTEEERERQERVMRHVEFGLTERIELMKKLIR